MTDSLETSVAPEFTVDKHKFMISPVQTPPGVEDNWKSFATQQATFITT